MKTKPAPAKSEEAPFWDVLARIGLGALFVTSGYSKATYPAEAFAAAIETYRLLPDFALMPLAVSLPWVELIAGAFLLTGYRTRQPAAAIAGLLTVFLAVFASVILRKIDLYACGCFGAALPSVTPQQGFVLDAIFLALAVLLLKRSDHPWSLDRWINAGTH